MAGDKVIDVRKPVFYSLADWAEADHRFLIKPVLIL